MIDPTQESPQRISQTSHRPSAVVDDTQQIRLALDNVVATSARPMSLGLGLLYTFLTVLHAAVQQPPIVVPMMAIAALSALGLLTLHMVIRKRPVHVRWGNWIGAGMATVVLVNSLVHLALAGDLNLTSNISILLIGIGAYFLKWRWFIILSAVTLISWAGVVALVPMDGDVVHYTVWQIESILVGTILFFTRSRLVQRLERLRLQDERQKAELAAAMRVAEQNRESAEMANRAKSVFLANMSHEMRTPLTAILGYNELLQLQMGDDQTLSKDLHQIRQASMHLLGLIDNVLDISKIEAGRVNLQLETFPISMLIDEVVVTTKPLVAKKSNLLETELAEDLDSIHADRTKLRQILLNLIGNAAKFTDHGVITLRVWMESESKTNVQTARSQQMPSVAVFQVRDTGIGLTAEQLDYLFVEFQQGNEAQNRQYGGAGLGLALSRKLCQLMGGDITGTGIPGQGATFTVRLPTQVVPVSEQPSQLQS
ncbi:MAG: ATP-binding protein [Chloroflexota bacterium]